MDNKTQGKRTTNNESTETRSQAAKKGWETRREHEGGSTTSNSMKDDTKAMKGGRGNNESTETRSEAAKKGWETRRENEK